MAADNNYPILFNKIDYHRIKTKPGNVVVCLTDNHTNLLWLYDKSGS